MGNGLPGLGVMIQSLGGNTDDIAAINASIGKTIASVALADNELRLTFADGSVLRLWDAGQSCCEERYMVCDDDLASFAGDALVGVGIKEAPNVEYEYGEHEVQFLEVMTSGGAITAATHNEHNGYYGGFWIKAELIDPAR